MEDDHLGPARLRNSGRVVEHADRHVELLAALRVPHEARDRRVNGEDDARVARERPKALGPRIIHPELPLEVDLAGIEAALLEELDRRLRALARRHACRAEVKLSHPCRAYRECPSDPVSTLIRMAKAPP